MHGIDSVFNPGNACAKELRHSTRLLLLCCCALDWLLQLSVLGSWWSRNGKN